MSTPGTNPYTNNPSANHIGLATPVVLTRQVVDFEHEHLKLLADEKSNGGASHVYSLRYDTGETGGELDVVKFQTGPVKQVGYNGTSEESLLAIIIDRLQGWQSGPFACRENALAVTKLQEAKHWLDHRTRERKRRTVEGTSQA